MNNINIPKICQLLKKVRKWIAEEGHGVCNHDNENCPIFCINKSLKEIKK